VFDKGYAAKMIDAFEGHTYYQAGTMGRTAAYDHGLDMVITIPDMPGKVIRETLEYDSLIIVIYPKSSDSGKSFAKIIVDHAASEKPIMHVDCLSKSYTIWQGEFSENILKMVHALGYVEEKAIALPCLVSRDDDGTVTRHLQSCMAGEYVLCNNILIGTVKDTSVSISARQGRIVSTTGIAVKPHGLEKIGDIDIEHAKCCSTKVLREEIVPPRITDASGSGVAFINHAGADVYDLAGGYEGAVVVGDDTSRIVGDILYRYSMPVIAITDGDWDRLLKNERFFPGSVVLTVDMDDEVGKEIYECIFDKKNHSNRSFSDICEQILAGYSQRVLDIIRY
jgi:hypothetical protein